MRNVFNNLMIFLCVADLMVIISSLSYSFQHLHPLLEDVTEPLLQLSDCLSHVSVTVSVFMTISITLERYFAVCSPLTYQVLVKVNLFIFDIYNINEFSNFPWVIRYLRFIIFFHLIQTKNMLRLVSWNVGNTRFSAPTSVQVFNKDWEYEFIWINFSCYCLHSPQHSQDCEPWKSSVPSGSYNHYLWDYLIKINEF